MIATNQVSEHFISTLKKQLCVKTYDTFKDFTLNIWKFKVII